MSFKKRMNKTEEKFYLSALKKSNTPISLPQPYNDILERVTLRDKVFFEEHPEREDYCRMTVPGEFWPEPEDNYSWVYVKQIYPGVRFRMPFRYP